MTSQPGGAKKFLYTGPKKGNDDDDDDDLPWNFNSKNQKQNTGNQNGSKFEMDGVWSIQRNVNLAGGVKQPKSEGLHFNTNKNYYSRHGGGAKDKDEFGASPGGSSTARNAGTGGFGNPDIGGKSWSIPVGSQTSRRPFSYASQNPAENSISPRNNYNSSSGIYSQTGGSHLGSQLGSGMNSGNLSSFKGGSFNSQTGGNILNSQGSSNILSNQSTDRFAASNTSSMYNNPTVSSSSPIGASHSHNTSQRNSLFNSTAPKNSSQNSLFNSTAPRTSSQNGLFSSTAPRNSSQNGLFNSTAPRNSSQNGSFNSTEQRNTSPSGLFNVNSKSSLDSGSSGRPNKSFW